MIAVCLESLKSAIAAEARALIESLKPESDGILVCTLCIDILYCTVC